MPRDEDPVPINDFEQIDTWIEQTLRARLPQPDTQHDNPDLQLIQELHDYYAEEAQAVNDRLDRVWQRFERRAGIQPQGWRQAPFTAATPLLPQERRYSMREPSPLLRAFRRWPSRLGALAAAVLLVALVGGLITGLVLVRHAGSSQTGHPGTTTTSTSIPASTATSNGDIAPDFVTLKMLDAEHGWALNVPEQVTQTPDGGTTISPLNQYQVLATSDGGHHWKDVTPPLPKGTPVTPDFVTASLAWLLDGTNQLYLTTNGGRTWQQRTAPTNDQFNGVIRLSFLNSQDGWSLLSGNLDGNRAHVAFTLVQTTNGGQTWNTLQTTDALGNSPSGALPLKRIGWLTFLDASTGWATGGNAGSDGVVRLYVTHNGGATWQVQQVPLPSQGFSGPTVSSKAPTFFNAQDGILDVASSSANFQPLAANLPHDVILSQVIYVTHDGGATWQSGALLPDPQGSVSFSDANHGWVASSTTHDLWATNDGGHTWTKLPSGSLSAYAGGGGAAYGNLDFVSSQTGWATQADLAHGMLLLETEDGGRTWTQIDFSITGE